MWYHGDNEILLILLLKVSDCNCMNTMKRSMIGLCAAFACVGVANADVWVTEYTKTNGTVVEGHWRSNPNGTVDDNWSTEGNVNPHTGEIGTLHVTDGITQEEIDAIQVGIDRGVVGSVTQEDLNAANIIVSGGVIAPVINLQVTDARYMVNVGVANGGTQAAFDEAQLIVNNGVREGVTQTAYDAADSKIAGGVLEGITQTNVNNALSILSSGVRFEVAQQHLDNNQLIVDTTKDTIAKGFVPYSMNLDNLITTAINSTNNPDDNSAVVDEMNVLLDSDADGDVEYFNDFLEANEDLGIVISTTDDVNIDPNKLSTVVYDADGIPTYTLLLANKKQALIEVFIAAAKASAQNDVAQKILKDGLISEITAEDLVSAWKTSVMGVVVEVTQVEVDDAQTIVTDFTSDNTSFELKGTTQVSQELYEYAKTVIKYTEESLFPEDNEYAADAFDTATEIVKAGPLEAITYEQHNTALELMQVKGMPTLANAKDTVKKGLDHDDVGQTDIDKAHAVINADALASTYTDRKDLMTDADEEANTDANGDVNIPAVKQAEVDKNVELLKILTYARSESGFDTGTGASDEIDLSDEDIDLETMRAIIELAEAQILVETGVKAGVTQDDIDAAELIVAAGVEVTQAAVDAAQKIIDAGVMGKVTQSILDEAEALLADGVTEEVTQEDIDAAQAIVDAGVTEEVTQAQVDDAQATVDGGLIEEVTQADIDDAQAIVDAGVIEGVTLEQARIMQVLVGSGSSNENPTQEELETAQAIIDGYVTKYGPDVVQDVIDIYTIDGNDVDAFMSITDSSSDEDIAHDKKFVSHGGIDAVKALVNTGNVDTALSVLFRLDDDETLTVKDFIVKSNPDVSGSAAGSTAGVSVVGGAIGGHQQSIVASSGKYGLKKHSLSVSKQLGVSSGGEGRDTGAWMEVFGSASEMDMRDTVPGYNADSSGIVVGVDKTIGNMMIGAAISVADIDVDGKSSADSRTDSDQYQGTLYGTLMMDSFYVNGSVAYAHASNDTSRTGLAGAVTGSYGTDIYAASLGIGIPVDLGNSSIIPQATLSYASISPDAYTESGVGALHVDIEDMTSFGIKAGVAVINTIVIDGGIIAPKLRLMADWDISREKAVVNSSWVGDVDNTIYSTTGARPASLGAVMGAGVDYASDDGLYVLSLDYDLSTRSNFVSHAGSAKLRVNF